MKHLIIIEIGIMLNMLGVLLTTGQEMNKAHTIGILIMALGWIIISVTACLSVKEGNE